MKFKIILFTCMKADGGLNPPFGDVLISFESLIFQKKKKKKKKKK